MQVASKTDGPRVRESFSRSSFAWTSAAFALATIESAMGKPARACKEDGNGVRLRRHSRVQLIAIAVSPAFLPTIVACLPLKYRLEPGPANRASAVLLS